jgi:co-chaperonin GroES (HSP10)
LTLDSRERWTEVATVVAVGPGRAEADGRRPMDPDLVPGARVLIERRPCIALELEINSPKELENLLMIEEDDVLALVDDDAGHVIQVTRGRREP